MNVFSNHISYREVGLPLVEKIPQNWEIKKLKYLATLRDGRVSAAKSKLRYIGLENIKSWDGLLVESDGEPEGLASRTSRISSGPITQHPENASVS